ncbi:TRAP transporter small permease [Opitutia bacterium ISCC 51]|nr:TRAP transporter small permease [Opitutae bacterium ISCC 51]QXD28935.1 TRAP transporter small permease [Opitutae bacterium ISCC 52]
MNAFFEGYYRILKALLTLLMGLIIIPVSLQILSRYTGIIPRYIWTEEVARFCFVWIIMIGAMIAVRDSTHFDVDLLPHPKTNKSKGIRDLIVHIAIATMAGFFCYYGFKFAQFGAIQSSEMSGINMATIYVAFPLAGVTWVLFLIEKFIKDFQLIRTPEAEEEGE